MPNEPLKISRDEMYTAGVQDYIDTQASLARNVEAPEPQSWFRRLFYSNWFYLMIWGTIGALAAWGAIEPFLDDKVFIRDDHDDYYDFILFGSVAAAVGLFLGAAEGIMCRNLQRALTSGAIGLGVGLLGGIIACIPAIYFYQLSWAIAIQMADHENGRMTPLSTFIVMLGRAGAWGMVAIPAGLGQGIATREPKVIINGILGGVLGGIIGGFVFDPIYMMFPPTDGQATLSRGIGIGIIGLTVGLFIGLIEGWTKTAWLLMRKGPLAGKQFILFKDTTMLGSSPKAEIYLFKDPAIEPKHAVIYNRGGRFEIEDCNTPDGTHINGVPLVGKRTLQPGDQVVLGKTVLEFALKDAGT